MTTQSLQVVILAAGLGKRMHSRLPKVLHPLAGRPMLLHVLDSARRLAPTRLAVVIGHGGESVAAHLDAPDVVWALQERQLGTGHAVMQAVPKLEEKGVVLVLYGDVPRIASGTLRSLVDAAAENQLAAPHAGSGRPEGLRPHRARRVRARGAHRRGARRDRGRARHPRGEHRHRRRPLREAEGVARRAHERQRAGRVLSDRHRGGRGRRGLSRRGAAPAIAHRMPRRELQARARPARKAPPDGSCPGSARRGRDARRPRAHRRARRARLRARRVHRRELHLRGQGRAGRRREDRRPLHPARRHRRRGHRDPAVLPPRGSQRGRERAHRPLRADPARARSSPTRCTSATSSR